MRLYVDTKPTLEFDHNDRCMTVFGLYDLSKSCATRGYHPFLTPRHNAHHNMWHSDADPFTGYTKDEAIQACQADYDRRTAERFVKVELPHTFDADEYLNTLDIFHHPYITDRTDTEAYEVAELMARFVEHWAQSAIGAGEGGQP